MIPYEFNAERFSRWMAYVLRHQPDRYGLQPDRHGYVDLEEFLQVAKHRYPAQSPQRLRDLVESSERDRFEVVGGRVRARYGHSIPVEPLGPPVEPPPQLYHGTEATRIEAILASGLQPLDRRMLHLSQTIEEGLAVARRKTDRPAVFRIHAQAAHEAGVAFYRESKVYLVSRIPARFLSLEFLPEAAPPCDSA
jgi:putative RNA 2'-phosphotransferase